MAQLTDIIATASSIVDALTTRVVVPLLILILGIALGRLTKNLILRLGKSVAWNRRSLTIGAMRTPLTDVLASATAATIYTVSTVWALLVAGVLTLAIEIIGIFLGAIALIAIAMYVWDFLPNLIAGIGLESVIGKKRDIQIAGIRGNVRTCGLLTVTLTTEDGFTVVIPNRTVRNELRKTRKAVG